MVFGRLNKRIKFLKYEEVETEYNTTQELCVFREAWASIEPVSGREYLEVQKLQGEITHRIYTRYIKGITPDMLIQFRNRKFQIKYAFDFREKNEMLQILCIEKVGDKVECGTRI